MSKNCYSGGYNTIKKMIFVLDSKKNIPKIRYIIKKVLPLHSQLQGKKSLTTEYFFKTFKNF